MQAHRGRKVRQGQRVIRVLQAPPVRKAWPAPQVRPASTVLQAPPVRKAIRDLKALQVPLAQMARLALKARPGRRVRKATRVSQRFHYRTA